MIRSFSFDRRFFDGPGDGGVGGGVSTPAPAPAPAPPPAPAPAGAVPPSGPPPSPTPAPAPSGTPQPGATPPGGDPTQYTYPEDRSNWLPPDRHQSEVARAAAEAARLRAMLEAGTGVRIPEPAEPLPPAVVQARRQLDAIYPGMSQFMEAAPYLLAVAQSLQQAQVQPEQLSRLPDVFSGVDWQFQRHAQTTLESIHTELAKTIGTESLTPRQQRNVTQDFLAWLEEDRHRPARYAQGDRRLITEYLEDYSTNFVNPLRVTSGAAAAAAGSRAAHLPPAPRTSGIAPPPPAPPAADASEDQIHDNAWQQFQAALGAAR